MIRTFSDLRRHVTFEDRFRYLQLRSSVGESVFGFERYLNQNFYRSTQWRQIRDHVIARDLGCDLGSEEHPIHSRIVIHHMNPMTIEDIESGNPDILDPEFLITTSHNTHNAIHFGDEKLLPKKHVDRRPGDTMLWSR